MSLPILWVGMDVHKDFVMIAVFRGRATTPLYLERVSFDPNRLRRFFRRLADQGEIRSCYEASGAGYVLQRWMAAWGFACDLIAPSLIPSKAGDWRKHESDYFLATRNDVKPSKSPMYSAGIPTVRA